ncbi:MAG: DUF177 domain-containing protein [Bacillota bacterium]
MLIDVAKLKKEKTTTEQFNFILNLPWINTKGEKIFFDEPIEVSSRVTFTQNEVLVEGVIRAKVQLVCHRCLEKYVLPLEIPLLERFVTLNQLALMSEDEKQEELSVYKNNQINLEPLIEQVIYLALPMKALCNEDCLGLCHKCGCNLNVDKCSCQKDELDPRLKVLQQLLEK